MTSREKVIQKISARIHEELGWDGAIIVAFSSPLDSRFYISVLYLPELVCEDYEFPLDTTADDMVALVMLSLTFR
jgi:hypothetical protein